MSFWHLPHHPFLKYRLFLYMYCSNQPGGEVTDTLPLETLFLISVLEIERRGILRWIRFSLISSGRFSRPPGLKPGRLTATILQSFGISGLLPGRDLQHRIQACYEKELHAA